MRAKILLVEDDINLGYVVKDNLEISGFEVMLCEDGDTGLDSFNREHYDVCILDVMLPRKDGFALAEDIRRKNEQVPIIFLTAKAMKEDKITGFKLGADDYITKPFSIEELILRIEVCLKRSRNYAPAAPVTASSSFKLGEYTFDYNNLLLIRAAQSKQLTQKEADILRLFCINKDKVLKREEILKTVWGDDDYFMGRSLDVFISKLRKYLREDPRIEIINFHGVGFKLEVKE